MSLSSGVSSSAKYPLSARLKLAHRPSFHTRSFSHGSDALSSPSPRFSVLARARKGLAELLKVKGGGGDDPPRLTPGVVSPQKTVPDHIPKPPYADSGVNPPFNDGPEIHDTAGIAHMRASCALAADVLRRAGSLVRPGVTTEAIDEAVHAWIIEAGAYPSPLNYGRFPKSVCTSVNECMCHGIPDSRELREGDIINIDVTVYLDGYHGDCSNMFTVGKVSEQHQKLIDANREALEAAIAVCKPNAPFKDIGAAISKGKTEETRLNGRGAGGGDRGRDRMIRWIRSPRRSWRISILSFYYRI